ncbi:hypothetical protein OAX11_05175 [Flavobacteriaceae bacterium]|nr:hypothetical protein [Flavobacteriaceae bacterium]
MSVVFTSVLTMSFALTDANTTEVSVITPLSDCSDYCDGQVVAKKLTGRAANKWHKNCIDTSDYCNPDKGIEPPVKAIVD